MQHCTLHRAPPVVREETPEWTILSFTHLFSAVAEFQRRRILFHPEPLWFLELQFCLNHCLWALCQMLSPFQKKTFTLPTLCLLSSASFSLLLCALYHSDLHSFLCLKYSAFFFQTSKAIFNILPPTQFLFFLLLDACMNSVVYVLYTANHSLMCFQHNALYMSNVITSDKREYIWFQLMFFEVRIDFTVDCFLKRDQL